MGLRLDACGDAELVALVADEHRDALGELYRRHAGWLILRLRHRCADDGLAAEALQDTFVAVWRGAAGYRGSGEVAGWLWAISIRRLIALLRKRRPEPVAVVPNGGIDVVRAEELVLRGTEHGDLAGALRRLSPELRAVVQATADRHRHRETYAGSLDAGDGPPMRGARAVSGQRDHRLFECVADRLVGRHLPSFVVCPCGVVGSQAGAGLGDPSVHALMIDFHGWDACSLT